MTPREESWIVSGDAVIENSDEWKIVAAVYGYDGNPMHNADGIKERVALISAAPELLEVARDAANQLRTIAAIVNHLPRKYASQISPMIRYREIDKAVAKAEATK